MRRVNRGDLSGMTFGRNYVIERHHQDAQRHWVYRCQDIYDGSVHLVRDSELVPVERCLGLVTGPRWVTRALLPKSEFEAKQRRQIEWSK